MPLDRLRLHLRPRETPQMLHANATLVQATFRALLARRHVIRLRQSHRREVCDHAACTLQAAARGHARRTAFQRLVQAAACLERVWHARAWRRHCAAVCLQRCYRGSAVRRAEAATAIQCRFRGRRARQETWAKRSTRMTRLLGKLGFQGGLRRRLRVVTGCRRRVQQLQVALGRVWVGHGRVACTKQPLHVRASRCSHRLRLTIGHRRAICLGVRKRPTP